MPPGGGAAFRVFLAVYAVAELTNGGKPFSVLYPDDVAARRTRSAAARLTTGPWVTDTEAMWRKSAVRELQKWLPQTADSSMAATADESIAAPDANDVIDVPESEDA